MARKQPPIPNMPPVSAGTNSDVEVKGGELTTLNEQGKAPRTRMRDAKAMFSLYRTLLRADTKSAHNRAILQDMADGAPPFPDEVLAAAGHGWVYNLNFLEADTRLAGALAAYDDLVDSLDCLIVPHVKPGIYTDDVTQEARDIVAEEHATLIREQSEFYSTWQILAKEFVGHGVGWTYYPDKETWKYESAGWDEVLIPRKTKATEESVNILMTHPEWTVDRLYSHIDDPQFAAGWNVKEVQRAIVLAARTVPRNKSWEIYWPEVQRELKQNDLAFGLGDAEMVKLIQCWQREFDGSYSFYIGLADGSNTDYLYKDLNRYKNANEAFTGYTLGVGNKTYHSIRGALHKMHAPVSASNRFRNSLLTSTDMSMKIILQGEEGASYDDMQITLQPGVGYLPAGATVVERKLPDVATEGMPILHELDSALDNATSQFQSPEDSFNATDSQRGNPETKYGIQARQARAGSLTGNSVNRFYRSADKTFAEQFRRLQNIGPTGTKTDKDGCRYPEVKDFFERCKERLQPLGIDATKFITKDIRKVTAARAIGKGSPQARMLALDRLNARAGSLDETGRALAARDAIAAELGREAADRYKPRVTRLAPDITIAVIENAALKSDDIPVLPDQNHKAHASVHVPKFQDVVKQIVEYREENPEADFTPLRPQIDYAMRLHTHSSAHVQGMAANPIDVPDAKAYNAALEQGGNLLAGFARELQQQERHQALNQQQPSGQPVQPGQTGGLQSTEDAISASDPKLAMEQQRHQLELQQKIETHAKDMELASAKVAQISQNMRLQQIEADQNISQQIRANTQRSVSPA